MQYCYFCKNIIIIDIKFILDLTIFLTSKSKKISTDVKI